VSPVKQAVLFDLDGTLLDSLADITLCGNTALEISGLPQHTQEEYRNYIGNGADMLIRRMLNPEDYARHGAKVKADYMALYGDLCARGCKTYPGVPEMLHALRKAGIFTAVISNKPDFQVRAVWLSTFGDSLDLARGQVEGVPIKPDPAGPREVLKRLGEDCQCIAYVGDSEVDMQTGKNCGFYTVGVTWGMKSRKVLRESGADRLAASVEELTAILLELAGREKE
jgi:phosphoglycolate phosphatase